MDPIEMLRAEHRLIEKVLDRLAALADQCTSSGELDTAVAGDAITFLREFADHVHHGKEEAQLFPAMERAGFSPEAGPTAVMREEHEEGRRLVARIETSIEATDTAIFVEAARRLVALLRGHIDKEEHCLFPMAAGALGTSGCAELAERFAAFDRDEVGAESSERHRKLIERLS